MYFTEYQMRILFHTYRFAYCNNVNVSMDIWCICKAYSLQTSGYSQPPYLKKFPIFLQAKQSVKKSCYDYRSRQGWAIAQFENVRSLFFLCDLEIRTFFTHFYTFDLFKRANVRSHIFRTFLKSEKMCNRTFPHF